MTEKEFKKYASQIDQVYKTMIAVYEAEQDVNVLGTILVSLYTENLMMKEDIQALRKAHDAIINKWVT